MMHNAPEPEKRRLPRSVERQYIPLEYERLKSLSYETTAHAALAAQRIIEEVYAKNPPQNKQELEALKVALDQSAVNAMTEQLNNQRTFSIMSVGSEGAKEVQYVGHAAPNLDGWYGHHAGKRVHIVSDAVEGTTAAASNKPGAISVVALAGENGLLASQDRIFYMEKLFGPADLAGKISLHFTPEHNLRIACNALQVSPEKLMVVILDRPRNREHIEAAQNMGVDLRLIQAGDLVPSIMAAAGRHPQTGQYTLVMGIGGYEEGVIAAAAAKALDAAAQGRIWQEGVSQQRVLELDDLVPGLRENIIVSAHAITEEPWFGLRRADYRRRMVEGFMVTGKEGLQRLSQQPIIR